LAPWSLHRETVDLLDQVRGVLDEYLPLTVRQAVYHLALKRVWPARGVTARPGSEVVQ
jgi:hypothetical protein